MVLIAASLQWRGPFVRVTSADSVLMSRLIQTYLGSQFGLAFLLCMLTILLKISLLDRSSKNELLGSQLWFLARNAYAFARTSDLLPTKKRLN